jgi:IstB-like ATP binding protein
MSRSMVQRDLVVTAARALMMPGVVREFETLARQAREEQWAFEDFLHEVLVAEQRSRRESSIRKRLFQARFPETKTLDTFDFTAAEGSVSTAQVAELARGEWISNAHNVIFAGPIGTGKTHLAIALGVEAAKLRKRVLFVRAADIVRQLIEARDAESSADCSVASPASTCSLSTSWASFPSTVPEASCSSTSWQSATRERVYSSPATLPSANGSRSSAVTKNSRPRYSTGSRTTPPSSPPRERVTA